MTTDYQRSPAVANRNDQAPKGTWPLDLDLPGYRVLELRPALQAVAGAATVIHHLEVLAAVQAHPTVGAREEELASAWVDAILRFVEIIKHKNHPFRKNYSTYSERMQVEMRNLRELMVTQERRLPEVLVSAYAGAKGN